jgi:hypothetical protein
MTRGDFFGAVVGLAGLMAAALLLESWFPGSCTPHYDERDRPVLRGMD